jgi:uncharacterized protein (DUF4415 family)
MKNSLPLIDEEGEVRELTLDDLRHFRPAAEVLPPDLLQGLVTLKKRGRPAGSGQTEQVAIRVSSEALAKWRSSGKGWQTRAAALLAQHAPN